MSEQAKLTTARNSNKNGHNNTQKHPLSLTIWLVCGNLHLRIFALPLGFPARTLHQVGNGHGMHVFTQFVSISPLNFCAQLPIIVSSVNSFPNQIREAQLATPPDQISVNATCNPM